MAALQTRPHVPDDRREAAVRCLGRPSHLLSELRWAASPPAQRFFRAGGYSLPAVLEQHQGRGGRIGGLQPLDPPHRETGAADPLEEQLTSEIETAGEDRARAQQRALVGGDVLAMPMKGGRLRPSAAANRAASRPISPFGIMIFVGSRREAPPDTAFSSLGVLSEVRLF